MHLAFTLDKKSFVNITVVKQNILLNGFISKS